MNKIIDIELYQTSQATEEGSIMEAMEKALFKKGLLGKSFRSVTYFVNNPYNTLVPLVLFDEMEGETLLRFNHQLPQGYSCFHEPLRHIEAVNVYAMSSSQHEYLRNTWPGITFIHQSTLFIDSVLKEEPYENAVNAYVNVNSHSFNLAIVNSGELTFFNTFNFNTKDDFIYFLLYTLEQQQLADADIPVYFTGLVTNNSEIIRHCERYIRRVRFLRPNATVNVDIKLNNTPFQYYYIPYKYFSCES